MDFEKLKITNLLDTSHTIAKEYIDRFEYPWEVLPEIKNFILDIIEKLKNDENYTAYADGVIVAKDATISDKATIIPPCVIGGKTEVRPGAYIRGNVIVGDGCVVGNSTELKNCILFDKVQTPHYNYVGDSILGYYSHTGAGAITSNVKSDKTLVTIKTNDNRVETGLKKFGAIIGDYTEIGCGSVLNPGTIIGKHTNVYPLTSVRGYVPSECIVKSQNEIVTKSHE